MLGGNYFKYVTNFKSALNHQLPGNGLTRSEGKSGKRMREREKEEKGRKDAYESDKLNFRYACLIISHGRATV